MNTVDFRIFAGAMRTISFLVELVTKMDYMLFRTEIKDLNDNKLIL